MKHIVIVLAVSLVMTTSLRADWEFLGFPGEQVRTVAVHPEVPNILLAAGEYTWWSMDYGATWEETSYYPANQLYFDPANPNHVYLAWGLGSWSDGLYRSTAAGEPDTWDVLYWVPFATSVVVPSWPPGIIFLGVTDEYETGGVYVSYDDGATWGAMNEGLGNLNVLCLSSSCPFDTIGYFYVYAGTEGGIYLYDWDYYLWICTSLQMPSRCIFAYDDLTPIYATLGWGSYSDGIYYSEDYGFTWDVSFWYIFPTCVHVAPMHEDYVFAGDSGYGVVFTPDGGTNWFDLNNGLDNLVIRCFAQSPADPSRLYAGTDEGLYVHEFPPPSCGDANGDGEVTSGDGFLILNYFGSGPEPIYCWTANVDGTWDLTPSDGFFLLNYLGGGSSLDCKYCTFPGMSKSH